MANRRSFADPSHPKRIEGALNANLAINLRMEGKTYQQIADIMGYSDHTGARKAVLSGLKALRVEPSEELRTIELARLDELWDVAYGKAKAGSMPAIDRCLKIQARRAALMGLDAPKEIDIRVTVRQEAERLARELGVPVEEFMIEVEGVIKEEKALGMI